MNIECLMGAVILTFDYVSTFFDLTLRAKNRNETRNKLMLKTLASFGKYIKSNTGGWVEYTKAIEECN